MEASKVCSSSEGDLLSSGNDSVTICRGGCSASLTSTACGGWVLTSPRSTLVGVCLLPSLPPSLSIPLIPSMFCWPEEDGDSSAKSRVAIS